MSKERLTERFSNGQAAVKGCGANCNYGYKYCVNHVEDCPTITEIYDKLAEYEDLEEQGLLLKLPCKVGDTVLEIVYECEEDYAECQVSCDVCHIRQLGIEETKFTIDMIDEVGNWFFLTQSEAEEKLRELEGK